MSFSVPVKLRKKLGLDKYKKAVIFEDKGKIIIEPVKDFLELGGSLKTKKKSISAKKMHQLFEAFLAEEAAK